MNWKKLGNIVGQAAPLVGAALGGPAGGAIGTLLAGSLGVKESPQAIEEAIRNNPDALMKLKQFELENEQHLRDHAFKVLNTELKDKQSAREHHKHNPMPAVICIAITLLVAGGAYMLFTMDIPESNEEIAYLLFGTLLAKWGDTIAYWVGTTRSSQEKTRLLK